MIDSPSTTLPVFFGSKWRICLLGGSHVDEFDSATSIAHVEPLRIQRPDCFFAWSAKRFTSSGAKSAGRAEFASLPSENCTDGADSVDAPAWYEASSLFVGFGVLPSACAAAVTPRTAVAKATPMAPTASQSFGARLAGAGLDERGDRMRPILDGATVDSQAKFRRFLTRSANEYRPGRRRVGCRGLCPSGVGVSRTLPLLSGPDNIGNVRLTPTLSRSELCDRPIAESLP